MPKKLVQKYKEMPVQVRASLWFMISGFLTKGISVITTPIFTRLLTTEEYGQYSYFNSWYGIISVIITLNLSAGVYMQGMVKFNDRRNQFSSALQGLTFVLICLFTSVYLLSIEFWNKLFSLTTVQMLALIIMAWLSSSFAFWSREQRVDYKYKLLICITLLVAFLKPIMGIILVVNSQNKVIARILGIVLVEITFFTWTFFYQIIRGKKFYSKEFWLYALKFNIPLIPHYLSMVVLSSSDRIMISKMVGESEAGIYNLAYSISQIMHIFNTALIQTIEPWLYKKIHEKNIQSISKIAVPAFCGIAMLNVLLMLFAPEVIRLFAPEAYIEAIWIIPPVAMSVFFMFLYTFFAAFEFYYEKTKSIMWATTIGAVINIVLNYACINKFGYMAAGYTTLVCYMFFSAFHYCAMRKLCTKYLDDVQPYRLRTILLISTMFILIGLLILFTYYNNIVRYMFIFVVVLLMAINRKKLIKACMALIQLKKGK